MDLEVMRALLAAFERSDWEELIVTDGDERLYASRHATPAQASAPAPAPAPDAPPASTTVSSPSVGTFHPSAQVGDSVDAGDRLATVEARTLVLDVTAAAAGTVAALLASDGDGVEYGTDLLVLEHAG